MLLSQIEEGAEESKLELEARTQKGATSGGRGLIRCRAEADQLDAISYQEILQDLSGVEYESIRACS